MSGRAIFRTALAATMFVWLPAQGAGASDLASTASGAPSAAPSFALRLPLEEGVPFNGVVNYDGAGIGSGAMLYPAPNLIAMVAAVATHGLIAGGARENQKLAMREKANEVLKPYQAMLGTLKQRDLIQAAIERMHSPGAKTLLAAADASKADDTLIETSLVYFMTQDQRALILENTVSIKRAGGAEPYTNVVRVVTPAIAEQEPARFWSEEQGAKLREQSALMLAISLDLAIADAAKASDQQLAFKTIRYVEGGLEKMERGQIIGEQCKRVVLKTLRGNLMSVPRKDARAQAGSADCDVVQTAAAG
ncbi:MAG: hypothetical protein V4582_25590 [Pseudomonadota bacterium]